MKSGNKGFVEKIGEKTGFFFMFVIFTTILYFILKILNKIPDSWSYFNVLIITILIVLFGMFIKKMLG